MQRYLIILSVVISFLAIENLAFADPYMTGFGWPNPNPRIDNVPGLGLGIRTRVKFGPFMDHCEYPWHCQPPPEVYALVLEWNSPNAPNCWWRVATIFMVGDLRMYREGFVDLVWQSGDGEPPWLCGVFSNYIEKGMNDFDFFFYNLVSGLYRVRTFVIDWYEWQPGLEYCDENKPLYMWGRFRWEAGPIRNIQFNSTQNDFIAYEQLFYINAATNDTIYDDNMLDVLSYYNLACVIRTTRRPPDIPQDLLGWFYPEGALNPIPVDFDRWAQGDAGPPCDPFYPLRDYAYITDQAYRPLDLWNFQPEEWSSLELSLGCTLWSDQNPTCEFVNNIGIREQIISNLCLRPLNDTTYSFIPAKGEYINFQFIYSTTMGLGPEDEVYLKVEDCNHELVYISPVAIPPPMEGDPNEWGLPFFDWGYMLPVSWNGRNNYDVFDYNRLPEPDDNPYRAYIMVEEGVGLESNSELFNVIPFVDSILISHTPPGIPRP
jgi:hypothetical protein